jgi:hypothetical protein
MEWDGTHVGVVSSSKIQREDIMPTREVHDGFA